MQLPTSFLELFHEFEKITICPSLSFYQEIFEKFPPTDVFPKFLPTYVFAEIFWNLFKKYAKKNCTLIYNFIEFFEQFSKIKWNLVNFLNFEMNFHTHKWVVWIFFEIVTYLIYLLNHLWNFQSIWWTFLSPPPPPPPPPHTKTRLTLQ